MQFYSNIYVNFCWDKSSGNRWKAPAAAETEWIWILLRSEPQMNLLHHSENPEPPLADKLTPFEWAASEDRRCPAKKSGLLMYIR
jgi:hypothetical protein